MYKYYIFLLLLIGIACRNKEDVIPVYEPELMDIPLGFDEIVAPSGNEYTAARWALGKKLFYDPLMSADSSISCASCHNPELAFSDDVAFSKGVAQQLGTRNAPSLANLAYHPYFTREGGVPTLEMQILIPIQEEHEFNFNIILIAERMAADPTYVAMSAAAYDREPNAFVITRALSCFERSLLSGYSPYDQYVSHDQSSALSGAAQRGMSLFFSERTHCSTCHAGFNFSNYAFENNGLYENYEDDGRFRLTADSVDLARFKVPSLRNVELTAPYMHDGSIATLEAVIDHYNSGGENHPNKSNLIQSLSLTSSERSDLLAFLQALTDDTFVNNPDFRE